MLIPGNTWQTVWIAAKPVPARRQVRAVNVDGFRIKYSQFICLLTATTF